MQFLHYILNANCRHKNFIEIFSATFEARSIPDVILDGPLEQTTLKNIENEITECRNISSKLPAVHRNYCLIQVHIKRKHYLLVPGLNQALTSLLR